MLERIRSLFRKQATPTADARSQYLKASLGMISGGSGLSQRPLYSAVSGVRRFRSWVYAAANINAFGVSSVPLRLYIRNRAGTRLYRTAKVGRDRKSYLMGDTGRSPSRTVLTKMHDFGADFEEVTESHPVLDLLRKVNPAMNGFDLAATRTLWQELTGNAYLRVIRNQLGVPAELWPMPPQWVEIVPSETTFIAGYKYGRESNSRITFQPDEVLHFKRTNPEDLYYGLGKVEAAWGVIDLNEAFHEMDTAMAANRARPDYLATIQNTDASEEAIEEFERMVNERLRGADKAGKFIALTGQVDLKPMQFPPKDLGGRDEIVEEIAAVFGVPVSMLKANDPNLASATTGFAQWRESTILPLLRLDEETLNQKLLPMFGLEDDAVLAYDDPVPANRQLDLTEHQTLIQAGVMTINEVREARGLEALDVEEANVPIIGGVPVMDFGQTPDEEPEPVAPAPGPDGSAADAPAAPAAEPTAAPLNGAQIQAAQDILLAVTAGSLATAAAEALLVAIGLTPAQARSMVAAQATIQPQDIQPLPDAPAAPVAEPAPDAKAVAESAPARYAEIDFTPTKEMAAEAERGLRLRGEFNRGGTEIGVARATQLKNREVLSPDTVRRMNSYFARHAVDKRPGWDDPSDPSAGFIAWLLWGGDAGRDWAERTVERMDRADDEDDGTKQADDCVSEKVRTLMAEGYPQDQAVAIAIDYCEGKAKGCGCDHGRKSIRQSDLWLDDGYSAKANGFTRAELRAIRELERTLIFATRREIEEAVTMLRRSNLTGQDLIDEAMQLVNEASLTRSIDLAIQVPMERVANVGSREARLTLKQALDRMGLPYTEDDTDQTEQEVGKAARRSSSRLAGQVAETTRDRVREIVARGLEEGQTNEEIADRIEDQGFDRKRAMMIARTEGTRALNDGQIVVWKQNGSVAGKKWLVAPEACPFCTAVGKEVEEKSLDEAFYRVGDTVTDSEGNILSVDFANVDGPPLHPNCRCTLLPVIERPSE